MEKLQKYLKYINKNSSTLYNESESEIKVLYKDQKNLAKKLIKEVISNKIINTDLPRISVDDVITIIKEELVDYFELNKEEEEDFLDKDNNGEMEINGWQWDFYCDIKVKKNDLIKKYRLSGDGYFSNHFTFSFENN